jgi:rsbT antagonist protein RsbS
MPDIARIPIIKLYDNLIVSIQVSLSDQLVIQLKEDVTDEIERTGARGLVVDVSGIDVMDSYISRAIRDIGLMAQLMGVHTVISGMDPMIAMTLVEMGLDLKGVYSALNLESALELMERKRKKRKKRHVKRAKQTEGDGAGKAE